jgi:8-oxo-dGTP diphosphatase
MNRPKPKPRPKTIERQKYVVGFLFDPTLSKVVLIRKIKPDWQKGLLNGVGGKVGDNIPDETPEQAIHREFREEAGAEGLPWQKFMTLTTPHSELHFFRAVGNIHKAYSAGQEDVNIYDVHDIMDRCDTIPNLRWCLQMARTFHYGERAQEFKVEEVMVPEWAGNGYEVKDGKWVGK